MTDGRQYQSIHRAALTECEARLEARDREIEELRAECERLRHCLQKIERGAWNTITESARSIAAEALAPPESDAEWTARMLDEDDPRDSGDLVPHTTEQSGGPKRGPANSNGDFYGVCPKCERSLEEHVTFYCPDCGTPEQAHGDALAAFERLVPLDDEQGNTPEPYGAPPNVDVDAKCRDREIVRRHLTASGVPEGDYHEGFEEGMKAGHGVPYVPDEVRRLPEKLREEGEAYTATDPADCEYAAWSAGAHSAADRIEAAIASTPAVPSLSRDWWRTLEQMANQTPSHEMTEDEREEGDFEGAFDIMVTNARRLWREIAAAPSQHEQGE